MFKHIVKTFFFEEPRLFRILEPMILWNFEYLKILIFKKYLSILLLFYRIFERLAILKILAIFKIIKSSSKIQHYSLGLFSSSMIRNISQHRSIKPYIKARWCTYGKPFNFSIFPSIYITSVTSKPVQNQIAIHILIVWSSCSYDKYWIFSYPGR